jgi:predicted HicB family RNase H-like nuclease
MVTFRIDPELLDRAKQVARAENRTLTNFVETVLKRSVEASPSRSRGEDSPASQA